MSVNDTNAAEREDAESEAETNVHSRAKQIGSNISERGRNGLVAMATGGALLARAVRTIPRSRSRAALQMAIGTALIGVGLRQRRSGTEDETASAGSDEESREAESDARDDEDTVSAEASAELEPDVVADENPRDIAGDPESEPEGDEENVEFTDDQMDGSGSKPNLDAEGAEDPRLGDESDETVKVDLSEASVAEDTGEAAGPTSQQSQPVNTEGTEPEPTPTEDASHMQADEPEANSESDPDRDDDSESEEAEADDDKSEADDDKSEADDETDESA